MLEEVSKIVFFNYYGVGDLFNSREFVKDVMRQAPDKDYFYDHGKPESIFEDIPIKKASKHSPCIASTPTRLIDDTLYINTWIGRDSSYVLPGIGCKIEQNKRMFNALLNQYGFRFERPNHEYVPRINWTGLKDWGKTMSLSKFTNSDKLVLISNGHVQSSQADNFDFKPVIQHLTNTYTDIQFLETHRSGVESHNLVFTGDLLSHVRDIDVNHISLLMSSLGADITVIGRSSGPFTCCMTRDFVENPSRKALTFVNHKNAAYFLDDEFTAKARLDFSLAKAENEIIDAIEEIIDE